LFSVWRGHMPHAPFPLNPPLSTYVAILNYCFITYHEKRKYK
jgi:hypothetical protein